MGELTERFSSQHWLKFAGHRVSGCSCGFLADDEDCGYGDSVVDHFAEVVLAARRELLAERVRALADEWETQGAGPDSMMRKTGVLYAARLRALLDDPALPSRTHRNGPRSDAGAGAGSRGHREPERGSNDTDGIRK